MTYQISAADLNKKISAIAKVTNKWRDAIQDVLVGCAYQSFTHGNAAPSTKLLEALRGADLKAVHAWLEKNSPVRWAKAETQYKINKSFKGEFDPEYLSGVKWYEKAQKVSDLQPYDALESLRALISKIEKEVKLDRRPVKHAEMVDDLKALAGKIAQRDIPEDGKIIIEVDTDEDVVAAVSQLKKLQDKFSKAA